MSNTDSITNAEFQIKAIELINYSLQTPSLEKSIDTFNFNLNIESSSNREKKLIFVVVHIEIKNDDQNLILGSISVSCIFEIKNFDELVKTENDGSIIIPSPFVDILNSISISTTRGVMFTTFRGTFLHSAVLPIIDPKQIQLAK